MNTYNESADKYTLKDILKIKTLMPDPTNETVMQKVINPNHLDRYFIANEFSSSVSGVLVRFSDVQDLKSYADIYNSMRLDYKGTPFAKPGADKNSVVYVIRFRSNDTESKVVHSVKGILESILGIFNLEPPYTGNGFLASVDSLDLTTIPGKSIKLGNRLIPEYYGITVEGEAVKLNDGAEMYKITEQGEEMLYAIYYEIDGFFKKIGE